MKYEYTKKDWFVKPPSYKYSKYIGYSFYKIFFEERNKIIDKFDENLKKRFANLDYNELEFIFIKKYCKDREDQLLIRKIINKEISSFRIIDLLKSIILNLKNHNQNINNEILLIINKFIKKFEINKRLFSEYKINFKKIDSCYTDITIYIYFSFVCFFIFKNYLDYCALNVGIKSMDLINSVLLETRKLNDEKLLFVLLIEKAILTGLEV